ncbi:MAG: 50S ribosomal protein L6 [Endozoicomonadaceae bacterium]|nr:50S ribosomal protein L6 [Endozoicomonadaceae bacterium]
MSRIANQPVDIPADVEVNLASNQLMVKGKKGSISLDVQSSVEVKKNENQLLFKARDGSKVANAMSGTMRSLANNMVNGVSIGFSKTLQLQGVGYRAQLQGKKLILTVGYSHPVEYFFPEGVTIEVPNQTEVIVSGIDKQLVGQTAAEIRDYRKPEPYKGKGIRYLNEQIHRKEAKKK